MYKSARRQLEDRISYLDRRLSTLTAQYYITPGPLMAESIFHRIEDLEAEKKRIQHELEHVHDKGHGAAGASKWAFPSTEPERGGLI